MKARRNSKLLSDARGSGSRGFSLIELGVVLCVISVLAAAIVPNILDATRERMAYRVIEDFEQIRAAAEAYYVESAPVVNPDAAHWPGFTSLADVTTTTRACTPIGGTTPFGELTAQGYLDNALNDPWGDPYEIIVDSTLTALNPLSSNYRSATGDCLLEIRTAIDNVPDSLYNLLHTQLPLLECGGPVAPLQCRMQVPRPGNEIRTTFSTPAGGGAREGRFRCEGVDASITYTAFNGAPAAGAPPPNDSNMVCRADVAWCAEQWVFAERMFSGSDFVHCTDNQIWEDYASCRDVAGAQPNWECTPAGARHDALQSADWNWQDCCDCSPSGMGRCSREFCMPCPVNTSFGAGFADCSLCPPSSIGVCPDPPGGVAALTLNVAPDQTSIFPLTPAIPPQPWVVEVQDIAVALQVSYACFPDCTITLREQATGNVVWQRNPGDAAPVANGTIGVQGKHAVPMSWGPVVVTFNVGDAVPGWGRPAAPHPGGGVYGWGYASGSLTIKTFCPNPNLAPP